MSTTAMADRCWRPTFESDTDSPSLTAEQSIALLECHHGRALRSYLTRLTGDPQVAQDIYQETLIRAWKHPEQRDEHHRYARPWLFTVAHRISIDRLRAAARQPATVISTHLHDMPDSADRIGSALARQEIRTALKTLNAPHREIIHELYLMDRSINEVAERLGIPSGTVQSRAYYALRSLRNIFNDRGLTSLTMLTPYS